MRSELRNWDSKITFFAFADIITAVSGMLIFITLLLATDLGRPAGDRAAVAELERRIQETLSQQTVADTRNARLEELLKTAETGPDLEKLREDVTRLTAQLAQARQRQATIAAEIAGNQIAAEKRDARLGLGDLQAAVQRTVQESQAAGRQEGEIRGTMTELERQVEHLEATLLKLRKRDGQIWLIPDRSGSTKEPILVTVGGTGATIERFDHPEQRKQLGPAGAESDFRSHLRQAKAAGQYVVFLVRPSGIALFQDLVQVARGMGFEVGYDALEEDREIHFSTPPSVDEPTSPIPPPPAADQHVAAAGAKFVPASATTSVEAPVQQTKPQVAESAKPPPPKKSWWQRLLEWLGLA